VMFSKSSVKVTVFLRCGFLLSSLQTLLNAVSALRAFVLAAYCLMLKDVGY